MHAVVRTYSGKGAKELFDILERRTAEVERVIGAVAGFHSYAAVRTADGGVTITVCKDKSGTDESVRVARDWVMENASGIVTSPPAVAEGPVIVQMR